MKMISILNQPYGDNEEEIEFYNSIKDSYPYELDNFQKHSCYKINKDENVLVTAHTGSGKTCVAEYAMKLAKSRNKKVVYTSPIKSLSKSKNFTNLLKKYKR